jgi:23S rRNA pseudouridine2605 synthase
MERSGNRFNKSRSAGGKKPFEKGSSFKTGKKRFDKREKDSDRDDRKSFSKSSDKPFRKKQGGFDGERGEKRGYGDKSKRPFKKNDERGEKRSFKKDDRSFGEKRSYGDSEKRSFRKSDDRGEKKFFKRDDDKRTYKRDDDRGEKKPFKRYDDDKRSYKKDGDRDEKKPFKRYDDDKRSYKKDDERGEKKPFRKDDGEGRSFRDKDKSFKRDDGDRKSFRKKEHDNDGEERKSYRKDDSHQDKKRSYKDKPSFKKSNKQGDPHQAKKHDGLTRLNKYLSNAGICSRREADDLIKAGAVSVNGKVVMEMGYKVGPDDKVNYGGETLRNQKKIYLLLNKPKDYITTTDDPQERRTVMELIEGACKERVYPVGRLDRNTTGLLLFTNDGEVATRLMHPKFGIKKVYHVTLNKNLKAEDFETLMEGVELEDGFIKPDELSYLEGSKKELGIEIHSGRNRIVRRLFEHIDYEVIKLDRVVFAGLTKKDLPRGKWRFLSEKEVGFLKMIG